MITKNKLFSYDNRVRTFWALSSVCVIMLCLYVYGIHATVRNTALREEIEEETSNLEASISEMEFSYISLKNDVSLELAYSRGFADVKAPTFISRRPSSLGINTVR